MSCVEAFLGAAKEFVLDACKAWQFVSIDLRRHQRKMGTCEAVRQGIFSDISFQQYLDLHVPCPLNLYSANSLIRLFCFGSVLVVLRARLFAGFVPV